MTVLADFAPRQAIDRINDGVLDLRRVPAVERLAHGEAMRRTHGWSAPGIVQRRK